MTRVSIKNIAEKTGVSNAAVSLVLNGKEKDGRISKLVADKVRQAAAEMNYRPNMAARSLRTGKTKTLGLIVADISNPFFAKLARFIENAAGEAGYQVMFGSSDESSLKFTKLTNLFIEKYVDGIIVAPPADCEDAIMQLENNCIPTVLVDRAISTIPVSSVQIDNVAAVYTLTSHLLKKGCRKTGFMAYNLKLPNIKGRYDGYLKALQEYQIPFDEELVRSVEYENFNRNIQNALTELLSKNIDSIVFATNRVGTQSLIALQQLPHDKTLQFASVDNPDEYKISGISITCIEQPIEELGKRALEILFRKISNPAYRVEENVTLQANRICHIKPFLMKNEE
jgi:LacI family transcriptional regulator